MILKVVVHTRACTAIWQALVTWKYAFRASFLIILLTLSCMMLKNGQTYFKNLVVFTPQDFKSMFEHFSTSCMKGLKGYNFKKYLTRTSIDKKNLAYLFVSRINDRAG